MKKGTIILIVVILIIAVAAYIFRDKISAMLGASTGPQSILPATGPVPSGVALCSDGITPKTPGTTCPTKCADGTFQQDPRNCPLQIGDMVYLSTSAAYASCDGLTGLGVYRYPKADSERTYLVGMTRPDWYPGTGIGKLIDITSTGWARISLDNIKVWEYVSGTGCTQTGKFLTGDYFIKLDAIQKTPY